MKPSSRLYLTGVSLTWRKASGSELTVRRAPPIRQASGEQPTCGLHHRDGGVM